MHWYEIDNRRAGEGSGISARTTEGEPRVNKRYAALLAATAFSLAAPATLHAQPVAADEAETDITAMQTAFAAGVAGISDDDPQAARAGFEDVLSLHLARTGGGNVAQFLAAGSDERLAHYTAWLTARSAGFDEGDWREYEYFSLVAESYSAILGLRSDLFEREELIENVARGLGVIAFAAALQGNYEALAKLYAPVLSGPDAALEAAAAQEIFERARSEWSWGGPRRDRAPRLVLEVLALFDRTGGRAGQVVGQLHELQAAIAESEGRIDDAQTALSGTAGEIDPQRRAGLLIQQGRVRAALELVLGRADRLGAGELSLEDARKLLEIEGWTGIGPEGQLALHEAILPAFRRELTIEDEELRTLLSSHAQALYEAGRASEAEPLLASLLRFYEARFSLDSGWGFEFADRLAKTLEAQQRLAEAGVLYRQLWEIALGYEQYAESATLDSFAPYIANLLARGENAVAERETGELLAQARTAGARDHVLAGYLLLSAQALLASGKQDAAQQAAREAVALGRGDDEWTVPAGFDSIERDSRRLLAEILEADRRYAAAESLRRNGLVRTQESSMVPREGIEMRQARLELARNLAAQGKDEATALFARELRVLGDVYGRNSPEVLAVSDPFARYLLETDRPVAALVPARRVLSARLAARGRTDAAAGNANEAALAAGRRDAALLVVAAAWSASRP